MDECIIETLSYFDIFDYPLTFSEIKKYLCCEIDCSDDELLETIQSISVVQESNGYFYFLGRNAISDKRVEKRDISLEKMSKARIVARILSLIPTIQYIGVSGSLSMHNASFSDDIDLFFITKHNTLWLTRFFVNAVLFALKQKRTRGVHSYRDKICPNMFLDEEKLTFTDKRKTLYTAHEIVQLKTLFDRADLYSRLISKNKWVDIFFPNFIFPKASRRNYSKMSKIMESIFLPFEKISFYLQKIYMKKHRTIETVTKGRALFHPVDRQKIILDMFVLRSKRYKKLHIDNIWVDREEAKFYMEDKKIRILN
jgi:hypothetical protein